MKKLLCLLSVLLLISCNEGVNNSSKNDETFSNDLTSLLNDNPSSYSDELLIKSKCYYTVDFDEEFDLVSLEIGYKETKFTNVRIIVLPGDKNLSSDIAGVCNLGYNSKNYILDKVLDASINSFIGYRLSYKVKDVTPGVKVSFISSEYQVNYSFSYQDMINTDTLEDW